MSVESEINRIQQGLALCYTTIINKGGHIVPEGGSQNSFNLYESIMTIPSHTAHLSVALEEGATVTAQSAEVTTKTVTLTYSGGLYSAELDEYGIWNITATKNGKTTTASVNVEEATTYSVTMAFPITVQVSTNGTAQTGSLYNGIDQTSNFEAIPGTKITFWVKGGSSKYPGTITIDTKQVAKAESTDQVSYEYTIPISTTAISISRSDGSATESKTTYNYGTITVTTQGGELK